MSQHKQIRIALNNCGVIDPENIKKFFSDPAGLFARFCVPTTTLGHKVEEKQNG